MNILDKLETLERNATTGAVQLGEQRPGHGDTLVLWAALFSRDGGLIAYMNSDADAALYAATRNALPSLLRVARASAELEAAQLDIDCADPMAPRALDRACRRDQAARGELRAALAALEAMP